MTSPRSFQHLQVSPLSNYPHEFLVTRCGLPGTSVVREAVEGLVVVEHRNFPLKRLCVVVFEHPEREGGVWFEVGGGVQVVTQELLNECSGVVRPVAGTEGEGDGVTAVNVEDTETRNRSLRICARRAVEMTELNANTGLGEGGGFERTPRPPLRKKRAWTTVSFTLLDEDWR